LRSLQQRRAERLQNLEEGEVVAHPDGPLEVRGGYVA